MATLALLAAFAPQDPAPRPTVAVLWFEDASGDPEAAHWRFGGQNLLAGSLTEAKSIRILSRIAVGYGFRSEGLFPGEAIPAERARRIGQAIEAQRIVWGSYRRAVGQWQAAVRVMDVTTGETSVELTAVDADWCVLSDRLVERLLEPLALNVTPAERENMIGGPTRFPAGVDWYFRALAAQLSKRPIAEIEKCVRRSLEEHPDGISALLALGSILLSQGKLEEGTAAVRRAMGLKPDLSDAYFLMGKVQAHEGRTEEALEKFQKAMRLDPDSADPLKAMGDLYAAQDEKGVALRFWKLAAPLEPADATIHLRLARAYSSLRRRAEMMAATREAERTADPDDLDMLVNLCSLYDHLGETAAAIDRYEHLMKLARKKAVGAEAMAGHKERLAELRRNAIPHPVEASPPQVFTEASLRAALQERLNQEEADGIPNPLQSSPEIRAWAAELTAGITDDMAKARSIFDALLRRLPRQGVAGARTAREVFEVWEEEGVDIDCDEYTHLYIALAREAGLPAFFCAIDQSYDGRHMVHACAAVFVGGKAVLADLSASWFGAPHQKFEILDDFHTVVLNLTQRSANFAGIRLAERLAPDNRRVLAAVAIKEAEEGDLNRARAACDRLSLLGPEHLYLMSSASVAIAEKRWNDAVLLLEKALHLMESDAGLWKSLALSLQKLDRFHEARRAYQNFLRLSPAGQDSDVVRELVAEIDKRIGPE